MKLTDQEFEHIIREAGYTPTTMKNPTWLHLLGCLRWVYELGHQCQNNTVNDSTHIAKHQELHKALDELVADYLVHHKYKRLSTITVLDLMKWSYEQTVKASPAPEESNTDQPCPFEDKMCPECKLELKPCPSGWICPNGHGF